VRVEVHETHAPVDFHVGRDRPDADGAVTTKHKRRLARIQRIAYPPCGVPHDLDEAGLRQVCTRFLYPIFLS
jgi:hypothetical protein